MVGAIATTVALSGATVTLLSGVYSDASAAPFRTVTIQAPAQSPFGGAAEEAEAGSFAWAGATEASLEADGFDPSATALPWPHYGGDPRGVMGIRVRIGDFATQAGANTGGSTQFASEGQLVNDASSSRCARWGTRSKSCRSRPERDRVRRDGAPLG